MHFLEIFFSKNFVISRKLSIFAVGIEQITNFAAKLQKKIDIYKKITQQNKFCKMNALFHGSIAKIQKMTGYSRTTISEALNHDTTGRKAERVRKLYNMNFAPIFKIGGNK